MIWNNHTVEEVLENCERVKQSIAQKVYYLEITEPILDWAKHYSEHRNNDYLPNLLRKVMVDQKLSRLQGYALVGLVVNLIYDADCMNDEIDNLIDNCLFSPINGDGSPTFSFPDDPPSNDPRHYAISSEWMMWQESN